jgi:hypothetical protein
MKIGGKMYYFYDHLRDSPIFFAQDIFQKFTSSQKNLLGQNKKRMCFFTLNDKPNCQVSRILMNPRPSIYVKRSEYDSLATIIDIIFE